MRNLLEEYGTPTTDETSPNALDHKTVEGEFIERYDLTDAIEIDSMSQTHKHTKHESDALMAQILASTQLNTAPHQKPYKESSSTKTSKERKHTKAKRAMVKRSRRKNRKKRK